MMRDAYAEKGEEIVEELKVPLDVKVAVWEADLAMAEENAEEGEAAAALAARLSDQLSSLRADRATGPRP